jgi:hypothetical protein
MCFKALQALGNGKLSLSRIARFSGHVFDQWPTLEHGFSFADPQKPSPTQMISVYRERKSRRLALYGAAAWIPASVAAGKFDLAADYVLRTLRIVPTHDGTRDEAAELLSLSLLCAFASEQPRIENHDLWQEVLAQIAGNGRLGLRWSAAIRMAVGLECPRAKLAKSERAALATEHWPLVEFYNAQEEQDGATW